METLTVTHKGSPVNFRTPYADAQVYAKLPSVEGTFAEGLVRQLKGGRNLSPSQWAWAHRLVLEWEGDHGEVVVRKKLRKGRKR